MPPKPKKPGTFSVGDAVFLVLAMNQARTKHEVIGPRRITRVDPERRRCKLDDNPYCWVAFKYLSRNYHDAQIMADVFSRHAMTCHTSLQAAVAASSDGDLIEGTDTAVVLQHRG